MAALRGSSAHVRMCGHGWSRHRAGAIVPFFFVVTVAPPTLPLRRHIYSMAAPSSPQQQQEILSLSTQLCADDLWVAKDASTKLSALLGPPNDPSASSWELLRGLLGQMRSDSHVAILEFAVQHLKQRVSSCRSFATYALTDPAMWASWGPTLLTLGLEVVSSPRAGDVTICHGAWEVAVAAAVAADDSAAAFEAINGAIDAFPTAAVLRATDVVVSQPPEVQRAFLTDSHLLDRCLRDIALHSGPTGDVLLLCNLVQCAVALAARSARRSGDSSLASVLQRILRDDPPNSLLRSMAHPIVIQALEEAWRYHAGTVLGSASCPFVREGGWLLTEVADYDDKVNHRPLEVTVQWLAALGAFARASSRGQGTEVPAILEGATSLDTSRLLVSVTEKLLQRYDPSARVCAVRFCSDTLFAVCGFADEPSLAPTVSIFSLVGLDLLRQSTFSKWIWPLRRSTPAGPDLAGDGVAELCLQMVNGGVARPAVVGPIAVAVLPLLLSFLSQPGCDATFATRLRDALKRGHAVYRVAVDTLGTFGTFALVTSGGAGR